MYLTCIYITIIYMLYTQQLWPVWQYRTGWKLIKSNHLPYVSPILPIMLWAPILHLVPSITSNITQQALRMTITANWRRASASLGNYKMLTFPYLVGSPGMRFTPMSWGVGGCRPIWDAHRPLAAPGSNRLIQHDNKSLSISPVHFTNTTMPVSCLWDEHGNGRIWTPVFISHYPLLE